MGTVHYHPINYTDIITVPMSRAGRRWQLELQWPGELVETQRNGEMTQKWVKHGGFDGDFMGFYYGFNGIYYGFNGI